jgi:nucleotide-binding universal stress UspA family protein
VAVFDRILVPLDGSPLAESALPTAGAIARQQQGELLLLRVPVHHQMIMPGVAGYGIFLSDEIFEMGQEEISEYLSHVQQRVARPEFTVRTVISQGDVAGAIVDYASDKDIDLIVMTTHGYSGITRWMLGSVAERVLRGAPCPVLVIREEGPLGHVVITLDGSPLAESAVEPGLALAEILGSRVTLLRVEHEEELGSVELGLLELVDGGLCRELEASSREQSRVYLECIAEKAGRPGLAIDTAVLSGRPAEAILDFLENQQADAVVMATHGYSGLRRWVFGSVTEKVLRSIGCCAMMVVRPPLADQSEEP